eukprot:257178-Prorocentrum_minimum.AAC.4
MVLLQLFKCEASDPLAFAVGTPKAHAGSRELAQIGTMPSSSVPQRFHCTHIFDLTLHNASLLTDQNVTIACHDLGCAATEEACPATGPQAEEPCKPLYLTIREDAETQRSALCLTCEVCEATLNEFHVWLVAEQANASSETFLHFCGARSANDTALSVVDYHREACLDAGYECCSLRTHSNATINGDTQEACSAQSGCTFQYGCVSVQRVIPLAMPPRLTSFHLTLSNKASHLRRVQLRIISPLTQHMFRAVFAFHTSGHQSEFKCPNRLTRGAGARCSRTSAAASNPRARVRRRIDACGDPAVRRTPPAACAFPPTPSAARGGATPSGVRASLIGWHGRSAAQCPPPPATEQTLPPLPLMSDRPSSEEGPTPSQPRRGRWHAGSVPARRRARQTGCARGEW